MTKVGVVGVGVIANAIVRGLEAKHGDELEVFLSPRNAVRAEALAKAFGNVRVMASNQEVLDAADWIILAVQPSITEETARALRFHPRHRVLSLASRPKLDDVATWVGECALLCRVIPQTFIEFRTGPILIYPPLPEVKEFFAGMGEVVATDTEESFILAQTLSCVMGPFFFLLDRIVRWIDEFGLPPEQSAAYLEAMFAAMIAYASRTNPRELDELWKEVTPGGLNEMGIRMIDGDGGYAAWIRALDAVRQKLV